MAIVGALGPRPVLTRDQEQDIYHRVQQIKLEVEKLAKEKARQYKKGIGEWDKAELLNEASENFATRVHQEFDNTPHIKFVNILIGSLKIEFFSQKGLSGQISLIAPRK